MTDGVLMPYIYTVTFWHSRILLRMEENNNLRRSEYVASKRSGALLKIGSFLFRRDTIKDDRTFFKCTTQFCKARATVIGGNVINERGDHDHANHDNVIRKKVFVNTLKRSAITGTAPLPQMPTYSQTCLVCIDR